MQASAEISMYPLTEQYEAPIIQFIEQLKQTDGLKVEVNGLSTQIFGEYNVVMDALKLGMADVFEANKAMFVLKIGKGELTKDKLPEGL